MEQLPTQLHCLTIQHIIDDVNAVETLLEQNSNDAKCLPLALRDAFNMHSIPDSSTTFKYLIALWYQLPKIQTSYNRYIEAAKAGLTYLLPYIDPLPDNLTVRDAMYNAAENNQLATLQYLLQHSRIDYIQAPLMAAAINGNVNILKYLLSYAKGKIPDGRIEYMISLVLNELRNRTMGIELGILPGNAANIKHSQHFLTTMLRHPERW